MRRAAAVGLAVLWLQAGALAQPQARRPEPPPPPAQAAPTAPPPYEPSLLRLSEILGALAHLTNICGAKDAAQWRSKMQTLLDAAGGKSQTERDRLAGAYNRGFRGYALSYRRCTPNAEAIIARFLSEGRRLADDLTNRFGAT